MIKWFPSSDIDECDIGGVCDNDKEYCVNTYGTFVCLCKKGFTWSEDRRCMRKYTGSNTVSIFNFSFNIKYGIISDKNHINQQKQTNIEWIQSGVICLITEADQTESITEMQKALKLTTIGYKLWTQNLTLTRNVSKQPFNLNKYPTQPLLYLQCPDHHCPMKHIPYPFLSFSQPPRTLSPTHKHYSYLMSQK